MPNRFCYGAGYYRMYPDKGLVLHFTNVLFLSLGVHKL